MKPSNVVLSNSLQNKNAPVDLVESKNINTTCKKNGHKRKPAYDEEFNAALKEYYDLKHARKRGFRKSKSESKEEHDLIKATHDNTNVNELKILKKFTIKNHQFRAASCPDILGNEVDGIPKSEEVG